MRGFLLAVLFGISCFASDVLVPGDPPLTRTTLANVNSILDWLAGTPLAPQQRETMEKNLIDTWRRRNPEEMKPWSQLSALHPVLGTLGTAQQQQLRQNLLTEMRKQGNPLAGLATNSSLLTGIWEQRGATSSAIYRDSTTGSYAAPSGNINRYTFSGDGAYEYAELAQVTNYNCSIRVFGYDKGSYSVNGNTITFTMQQHSLEYRDTCNPSLNSNKNLPLQRSSYPFQINGDKLVLFENGAPRWHYTRAQ